MKFVIKRTREAEADQLAAACWYEAQQPGLGDSFLDEIEIAVATLAANPLPLLYSVRFSDVRCIRLHRFKRYGIYYLVNQQVVVILAILHGARDPRWLNERIKKIGPSSSS